MYTNHDENQFDQLDFKFSKTHGGMKREYNKLTLLPEYNLSNSTKKFSYY